MPLQETTRERALEFSNKLQYKCDKCDDTGTIEAHTELKSDGTPVNELNYDCPACGEKL